MSNLADLLKQLSGANTAAINLAGNALGTLADLSGAVAAVTEVIGLFVSKADDITPELQAIRDQLNQDFSALNADQRAAHILDRLRDLDAPYARSLTVVDQLPDDLRQVPPVSNEYRLQQIGICLDAVNDLDQDDKWLSVFNDEIYYGQNETDYWTGPIEPYEHPDGTVFSDRYVLPYYLAVLYHFLITAAALEPNYRMLYATPLTRFLTRLQGVHDTMAQAIRIIRTPTQEGVGIVNGGYNFNYDTGVNYLDSPDEQSQWHSPFVWSQSVWNEARLMELEDAYFQEYGTVYLYGGYSQISYFPPIPEPTVPPDVFWPQFSARLNLAIRRNWKEAYAAIGLGDVWKTINVLRQLTGQPPAGVGDPGLTWSLRETNDLLGAAYRDPSVTAPGQVSASETLSRLALGGGITSQRPLSWRNSLDAALTVATITPWPYPQNVS